MAHNTRRTESNRNPLLLRDTSQRSVNLSGVSGTTRHRINEKRRRNRLIKQGRRQIITVHTRLRQSRAHQMQLVKIIVTMVAETLLSKTQMIFLTLRAERIRHHKPRLLQKNRKKMLLLCEQGSETTRAA